MLQKLENGQGRAKKSGETRGGPFAFVANKRGVCGNKKKDDQSGEKVQRIKEEKGELGRQQQG